MLKLPKFRLTTMLLLIAILALGLGWWQDWHRRNSPLYLHIFVPQNHSEDNPSPAKCVASMLIPTHGQFDMREADYEVFSGEVTCSPVGQYHLELSANKLASFNYTGPVEIDTITMPQTFLISGVLHIQLFAISHHKDGQSLLNPCDLSDTEKQLLYLEM